MGFMKPKTPNRPLDEGKTPQELAEQQRQKRLRFAGAAGTTLAGSTTGTTLGGSTTKKQESDKKTTHGGAV